MFQSHSRIQTLGGVLVALTAYFAFAGCSTDVDDGESFIPNERPTVGITSPMAGAAYTEGEEVRLEGTGVDEEDGALTGVALSWASDISGHLGTGSPLLVTLPVGVHGIVLTATDSQGEKGSNQVSVTILPQAYGGVNQPPVVTVTSPLPLSRYAVGETIVLEGTADDPEEGALTGASLTWKENITDVGTGQSGRVAKPAQGLLQLCLAGQRSLRRCGNRGNWRARGRRDD